MSITPAGRAPQPENRTRCGVNLIVCGRISAILLLLEEQQVRRMFIWRNLDKQRTIRELLICFVMMELETLGGFRPFENKLGFEFRFYAGSFERRLQIPLESFARQFL